MSALAPLIAISIVNWNTRSRTLGCLHAIEQLDYPHYRVIVVDNASVDDSVPAIRRRYPIVEIVCNPINVGFAAAHEQALGVARAWDAKAIWLINSDVEVDRRSLAMLVAAWQTHGEALYGGLPLKRSGDDAPEIDFPSKYLLTTAVPSAFVRDQRLGFNQEWRDRAPFRVGALVGSTFFVPLTIVHRHGWMDARWFLYCEEIDYCLRLRTVGVGSVLVPQSWVWHEGGGSHAASPKVADCVQYYRSRNEITLAALYVKRHVAYTIAAKKLLRGLWIMLHRPRRAVFVLLGVWHALSGQRGKTLAPERSLASENSRMNTR